MARTPKNLPEIQDKRAEVVRLRGQGLSWDQVAERTGYANGSGALKAWRRAIAQKLDLAVTEVRAAERERLEEMDAKLAEIIADPPAQHSAIGKIVTDEAGNVVRNMSIVVQALKERRMVGESLRRLTGADAAPAGLNLPETFIRQLAEARAAQERMDHAAPVPLQPLPPGYADLSPEQQAAADMTRRRAQVAEQHRVIRGELAP